MEFTMKIALAGFFVVMFAGVAISDDKKIDAGNLVGKWEVTKAPEDSVPKGAVIEFTKDGKLKLALEFNGKKFEMEGTYKVDGEKLQTKMKDPSGAEHEDSDTIKSLSADKAVLVGKEGKEVELTKVKEKK
jgi:uncharacterized protein (TIGR03066 family)